MKLDTLMVLLDSTIASASILDGTGLFKFSKDQRLAAANKVLAEFGTMEMVVPMVDDDTPEPPHE